MSKIDSMEGFKDCISRQQAIDKMQELEDEDIELYGCSIPEGFDGKRAIKALKTLPSIKLGPRFIIKSDGTIEQIKNCDVLEKIRAEIKRQEKWLYLAGYNSYSVNIALDAIKSVVTESEV